MKIQDNPGATIYEFNQFYNFIQFYIIQSTLQTLSVLTLQLLEVFQTKLQLPFHISHANIILYEFTISIKHPDDLGSNCLVRFWVR